jgi:hypothetical protein
MKNEYTLMHKNVKVVDIELIDSASALVNVGKVHNKEYSPRLRGEINIGTLTEWWFNRAIPASRQHLQQTLFDLGVETPQELLKRSLGLSLSDHYWIKPINENMKWEDVNFFENDFSDDVGRYFVEGYRADKGVVLDFRNPDASSVGWLAKRWMKRDEKRCLLKGGSTDYRQEPYNEVIATYILNCLNINHVSYELFFQNDLPFSLCENFVTLDTELIPAWEVYRSFEKERSKNKLEHFLKCCEKLNIPVTREELEKMIVFDYIIANEDRHFGNFGFIRDSNTLEFKGFAPIFDNGTSLWYNTEFIGRDVICSSFAGTHDKQIELVESFKWFNGDALNEIRETIHEIFGKSRRTEGVTALTKERAEKVTDAVKQKIDIIERLRDPQTFNVSVEVKTEKPFSKLEQIKLTGEKHEQERVLVAKRRQPKLHS